MPRLTGETFKAGSFTFSGINAADLQEPEYTLVNIVVDTSGSVCPFAGDLLASLEASIGSCKLSPRRENLLVRVTEFNNRVSELHGYKLLSSIDVYSALTCGGNTALCDAVLDAIISVSDYSNHLVQKKIDVNGVIFIITDGEENASKASTGMVAQKIQSLRQSERGCQFTTNLIAINASQCIDALKQFMKDCKLDMFLDFGEATESNLAKLAGFMSRSISTTSQSLASGTPLTF